MVEEQERAKVIRKQWVISFAQRKMQRELPGPQTEETEGGKKKERVERENMI